MPFSSRTLLAAILVPFSAVATEPPPPPPAPPPATAPASAPRPQGRSVSVALRLLIEGGGDTIDTVAWSDGSHTTLRAGQIATVAGGLVYHPAPLPLVVEATAGYKFQRAKGANGTMSFHRVPMDLVASYALAGHRLGIGATAHLAPEYSCKASGVCDFTDTYRTAFGVIGQYAYAGQFPGGGAWEIGLRMTSIKYSGRGLATRDGTCYGGLVGLWL